MRKNKIILLSLLVAVLFGFASCNFNASDLPEASIVGIEMGATDVDPAAVSYIDVKFDKSMNTKYSGFIYYGDIYYDIGNHYWVNSYTYRINLDLRYDVNYKLVINDSDYATSHSDNTYKSEFFRDTEGNKLKQFAIEFSTIPSTLEHPHTFELDLTNKDVLGYSTFTLNFADNSENTENTQQMLVGLKPLLNHEMLKKGDKVILKYKLSSAYDISEIRANLIDGSSYMNYWGQLNSDTTKDVVLVKDYTAAAADADPNIYEGEITFEIAKDMYAYFMVQLWADYDLDDDLYSIDILAD